MKIELSTATVTGIGKLSGGLGIGTSFLAFFEVNALGIGALCTFLTLMVYAFFSILNHFKNNKSATNKVEIDKLKIDVEKINSGIDEILKNINKLDK